MCEGVPLQTRTWPLIGRGGEQRGIGLRELLDERPHNVLTRRAARQGVVPRGMDVHMGSDRWEGARELLLQATRPARELHAEQLLSY